MLNISYSVQRRQLEIFTRFQGFLTEDKNYTRIQHRASDRNQNGRNNRIFVIFGDTNENECWLVFR